jgi:hypothetical protein
MIKSSDIPALTSWITESTGEAALGAVAAFLGAGAGAGAGAVCAQFMPAASMPIDASDTSFNVLSS